MIDRAWKLECHLRHLSGGPWLHMQDSHGQMLEGIEGMHGVRAQTKDGVTIGADFIRIQPGCSFPIHSHEGDHEIYFIEGSGYVHIGGKDVPVSAGHVIHIPAEQAHAVWTDQETLVLVAMGVPHRRVDDIDRMRKIAASPGGLSNSVSMGVEVRNTKSR